MSGCFCMRLAYCILSYAHFDTCCKEPWTMALYTFNLGAPAAFKNHYLEVLLFKTARVQFHQRWRNPWSRLKFSHMFLSIRLFCCILEYFRVFLLHCSTSLCFQSHRCGTHPTTITTRTSRKKQFYHSYLLVIAGGGRRADQRKASGNMLFRSCTAITASENNIARLSENW